MCDARAVFCWFLFFFAIFKAQAGCPFLPLSFGVWTNEPCECAALVNDISFFPYSICDYVRMHAHSSIVWMMAFPILFFYFPTLLRVVVFECVSGGRCLHCQHISVFFIRSPIVWHRYTDTGHSLWSNIKRCCLRHRGYMWNSLEWKKELCGSLTWCYQSND